MRKFEATIFTRRENRVIGPSTYFTPYFFLTLKIFS